MVTITRVRPGMLILHFRKTFKVRAVEWFTAGIVFLWGVVLLQPADTFANSASYNELSRWASEGSWGWFCLVGGGIRLTALILNGSARPTPHIRAATAILSSFFFFQLTLGFVIVGTMTTGFAVYPLAALFDLYSAMNAIEDAGLVDRAAKEERGNASGDRSLSSAGD